METITPSSCISRPGSQTAASLSSHFGGFWWAQICHSRVASCCYCWPKHLHCVRGAAESLLIRRFNQQHQWTYLFQMLEGRTMKQMSCKLLLPLLLSNKLHLNFHISTKINQSFVTSDRSSEASAFAFGSGANLSLAFALSLCPPVRLSDEF